MESKTISYFKEISKIPRESGNEKMIADYIVNFAIERNFDYKRDEYNNVIIKKYINDKEPIILQSHLDMVCEKENNIEFDFSKDSLDVYEEDGFLTARGTSLGADNGIGVAQMLNILDSNLDLSVEAIFTTNEETTMLGAEKIELSELKGRKMINLDGFDANTILIECASFTDIDIHMNYDFTSKSNSLYAITLSGLEGGHSGFEINRIHSNSIILMAKLLSKISDIEIAKFNGGTKINVIPSQCEAIINTSLKIDDIVDEFLLTERKEYGNLQISFKKMDDEMRLLNNRDSRLFLEALSNFQHGVFNTNKRNEVTTSENLALVDLSNNLIRVGLRSSIEEERQDVLKYLNNFTNKYGYELVITGYQPGFRTLEDSELVKNLIDAYLEFNNEKPNIKSVHIAVEVGLIKEKLNGLDVAIISPNIMGTHSPSERVEIESINRCDRWLFNFLNNMIKEQV